MTTKRDKAREDTCNSIIVTCSKELYLNVGYLFLYLTLFDETLLDWVKPLIQIGITLFELPFAILNDLNKIENFHLPKRLDISELCIFGLS